MNDFMNAYFGPLDKSSCVYFLIITVIFFIMLVISLFGNLFVIVKNIKKLNFKTVSQGLLIVFNLFIAYFVNRLLYTMCTKSLV
jgi:hypothetical protein